MRWAFKFKHTHQDDKIALIVRITVPNKYVSNEKEKWQAAVAKSSSSKEGSKRTALPPPAYSFKDTIVVIRREEWSTDKGKKVTTEIPDQTLKEWLDICLIFTELEGQVVRIEHGNLLLGEKHTGKIYLKDMLLPKMSATGFGFHYGYNLFEGMTDRDRKKMSSPEEEAVAIHHIWKQAMLASGSKECDGVAEKYIGILLEDDKRLADTNMAEDFTTREMASKLWDILRTKAGRNLFYYWKKEKGEVINSEALCGKELLY